MASQGANVSLWPLLRPPHDSNPVVPAHSNISVRDQVLRWSALGLGIFYGVYHQRTINSSDKAAVEHNDWTRKEKLIAEAKAQYAKLTAPRNAGSKDAGTFSHGYTLRLMEIVRVRLSAVLMGLQLLRTLRTRDSIWRSCCSRLADGAIVDWTGCRLVATQREMGSLWNHVTPMGLRL